MTRTLTGLAHDRPSSCACETMRLSTDKIFRVCASERLPVEGGRGSRRRLSGSAGRASPSPSRSPDRGCGAAATVIAQRRTFHCRFARHRSSQRPSYRGGRHHRGRIGIMNIDAARDSARRHKGISLTLGGNCRARRRPFASIKSTSQAPPAGEPTFPNRSAHSSSHANAR
jgi:hypothetical protein